MVFTQSIVFWLPGWFFIFVGCKRSLPFCQLPPNSKIALVEKKNHLNQTFTFEAQPVHFPEGHIRVISWFLFCEGIFKFLSPSFLFLRKSLTLEGKHHGNAKKKSYQSTSLSKGSFLPWVLRFFETKIDEIPRINSETRIGFWHVGGFNVPWSSTIIWGNSQSRSALIPRKSAQIYNLGPKR